MIFSSLDMCGRRDVDWNEGKWRNGHVVRGGLYKSTHPYLLFVDFDAMILTFIECYNRDLIIESVSYDVDELPSKFWSHIDTEISWKKTVKNYLIDCCIAFSSLHFPPYVLLEVFDWFPFMYEHVAQKRKIDWIFHI